jgi:hypothetical protein
MTKKQLVEAKIRQIVKKVLSEQDILFNNKPSVYKIGKKGNLFFIDHNGENLTGEYYSYIDNVLNPNGSLMVKNKNGQKKQIFPSDYLSDEEEY